MADIRQEIQKDKVWHKRWTEEERDKVRKMSQISMWLDSYDDLFSDFDPRPYSQRAMSDDFLSEARKVSKETESGNPEINFLVPEQKRDHKQENIIKKRLKRHFKKQLHHIQREKKKVIMQGSLFIMFGVLCMVVATLIFFYYQQKSLSATFFGVILEPAGWFLFWEGLNQLIFRSKKEFPDLKFYEQISKSEISFGIY